MKLPIALLIGFVFLAGFFVAFLPSAQAVTVAEQTQAWSDHLNVWQAIQELGDNLSGTAESFTFRVSTSASNLNQFDFTAQNSRIYDKTANTYIVGCVSTGSNPNDRLRGLTFTAAGVPSGYEDVTIDFSCRNYNFIPGHRYLILLSNANLPQWGGVRIKFAASVGTDQFSGGGIRYAFDNKYCNALTYVWNSQDANSGCNIFGNPKTDLYFVLNNNAPPPRLPVIFIGGIGGSEMKATQDIIWSKDDGHGGTYSHAYGANEKIWVNQDKAVELGDDDYFDVLRLKTDGVTPEADLSLTGSLTSFGYSDIDSFFTGIGYEKGKNYFSFPYDWRKDVRSTKDSLDALIESAKTASGQSKVNLVVHSMGGLVARYYISDPGKAAKVNKLIELGVPHLGATSALKALMYGEPVGRWYFKIINIGVNGNEVKDVIQSLPSHHSLIPSIKYFEFYNNSSTDLLYPFRDDRDIDNNNINGSLNFNQTKNLLSNLNYNMTVFNLAEQFHDHLDPIFNQTNGTQIHEIVGTGQPTLGQINETWWVTWPVNLFNKTDEIFINGDGTVPLYSASLKNDSTDISGAFKIYYVEQKHGDLVSGSGTAMQTVRKILEDDNALPVEVKDEKIYLEGEQVSLDDGELDLYDGQNRHCGLNDKGEMEENIPEVTCTTSGNTRHAFIKKKAGKVKVKATRKNPATSSKTTNIKKRTYKQDKISKTTIYTDINIPQAGKIEFDLDPTADISPSLTLYPDSSNTNNTTTINPISEVSGSAAVDQTPPATSTQVSGTQNSGGTYTGPVTITLTASDTGSGILNTEYSLDNGQTVQTYSAPFIVSASGQTTIQFTSIDKTGNEEIPQTLIIQIASPPTPTPTPTPSSSTASSTNSTTSEVGSDSPEVNVITNTISAANTPGVGPDSPGVNPGTQDILGLNFENPSHISDQINVTGLLDQQNLIRNKNPAKEILGGLLIVSGGIVAVASFGLALTLLKPIPK